MLRINSRDAGDLTKEVLFRHLTYGSAYWRDGKREPNGFDSFRG